MVKKAFRQGHSERKAEAYVFWYVEALSEARTTLEAFFNILSARLGLNSNPRQHFFFDEGRRVVLEHDLDLA